MAGDVLRYWIDARPEDYWPGEIRKLAAESFPEYVLIGGPHDGQRGVVFVVPMAYLELPLKRGILSALDISPIPVARYDLVCVDGLPSRDDDGTYRYQWREPHGHIATWGSEPLGARVERLQREKG